MSRPRGGRPPGLRGRAIGLYYRDLALQKKKEEKIKLGPNISIPGVILERVKRYLEKSIKEENKHEICNEFEMRFHRQINTSFEDFLKESKIDTDFKNETFSKNLNEEFMANCQSKEYQMRLLQREKLPAMMRQSEILNSILNENNQIVLIVGSTGCGKSTQVPQIILDHFLKIGHGAECHIVVTQPRRISTISLAERVSYERNEKLGKSVGYQIRLESKMPRECGSILYCTTGVLLQKMHGNPLMEHINFIILDEIHERSVEIDILMGLLKKILSKRPNLKVILMSATVSADVFCNYFDNCHTVQIDGTLFPVDVHYLEDILQETGYTQFSKEQKKNHFHNRNKKTAKLANEEYNNMIRPYLRQIRNNYDIGVIDALNSAESEGCSNISFLEHLIFHICEHKPPGAILVFLPGYDKISKLQAALDNPSSIIGKRLKNTLQTYPLHSLMPTINQQSVFQPPPSGMRKVILSTIIAETSVTIDDVVYVINAGRTKISSYNIEANIQTLEETWVTKANSQQRKGRAGRVQPGICYNLFTRVREATMDENMVPEILRSRLETIILRLKLLHTTDVLEFFNSLIDAPLPSAVQNGIQLLKRMEALDENERLTPLGMHLAILPIDPQTGKMLLMAALFRCLDPISSVAACLSFKSPFYTPLGQENRVDNIKRELSDGMKSDHLLVHNVLEKFRFAQGEERSFCYNNFLTMSTLQQLENMKQQFATILRNAKFLESSSCTATEVNTHSKNITLLRAIIAAGLYPNMAHLHKTRQVGRRVRPIHTMSTPEERRVQFHPSSVNSGSSSFESHYFVYFLKQKSSAVYLLDSTMVFPMALLIFGDHVEVGVADGRNYISVGGAYKFVCDQNTSEVILQLRQQLKMLLQKKAIHPSPIEFNCGDDQIVKAIHTLLSMDETSFEFMFEEENPSSNDSDIDY